MSARWCLDQLPDTQPGYRFHASPFYVADKLTPWAPSATPRRAALSSFGIGGSNVHAILEECAESFRPRPEPELNGPFLVPLSARNPERLREMMTNLGRFLDTHDAVSIADLAYTLSVGRTPWKPAWHSSPKTGRTCCGN